MMRVSPCAMVRNGPAPSWVAQAPQPPWPLSWQSKGVPLSRLPRKRTPEKVPKCAPVTRSGKAFSNALMIASITVGNGCE